MRTELTMGELEDRLLEYLAGAEWHDITGEEGTDPSAAQSLTAGFATKLKPVWIFSRYEDEGDSFSLVGGTTQKTEWKSVTKDQEKLTELWSVANG